jgi:bacterial/archaeal transporter family protein
MSGLTGAGACETSFIRAAVLTPRYTPQMNWVLLALTTAAAFGAYNVFIKLGSGKIDHVLGAVVLQVVAALLGGTYALFLHLSGRELPVTRAGFAWAALAGIAVGLAEIFTFLVFSRGAPASLATPIIMGGSILVTAVLGVLLLRERLGLPQLLGILLIGIGIALVSRPPREALPATAPPPAAPH